MSILRGSIDGFVCWKGVKCSTWVSICRATTLRSFFDPCGNQNLKCVVDGNGMASREALTCLLVMALFGFWCIEQPSSSLLFRHPRMQWLCEKFHVQILAFAILAYWICMCNINKLELILGPRFTGAIFGCASTAARAQNVRRCGAIVRISSTFGRGSLLRKYVKI